MYKILCSLVLNIPSSVYKPPSWIREHWPTIHNLHVLQIQDGGLTRDKPSHKPPVLKARFSAVASYYKLLISYPLTLLHYSAPLEISSL